MAAKRFEIGDHVSWSSEAGRVGGTITAVDKRDVDYKGHRHHASEEDVPPKLYGGTERVVSYLTEELVAIGRFWRSGEETRFEVLKGDPASVAHRDVIVWSDLLRRGPQHTAAEARTNSAMRALTR